MALFVFGGIDSLSPIAHSQTRASRSIVCFADGLLVSGAGKTNVAGGAACFSSAHAISLFSSTFQLLNLPIRQAHSHDLVAHDSEPDADDSDLQYIAEQGPQDGRTMVILRVEAQVVNTTSPAPQTSHVDDLGDLQEYNHGHDLHDPGTHGDILGAVDSVCSRLFNFSNT